MLEDELVFEIIESEDEEKVLEEEEVVIPDFVPVNNNKGIKIVVDCREKSLFQKCKQLLDKQSLKFKNIFLCSKNLELGDIVITDLNDKELIIIERKTLSDLLSSIKDNRYREQGFRLDKYNHPNHNIVYLIEGDNIGEYYSDKDMIYSSMFSLFYFKGFSLFRSKDVDESALIIFNAAFKILKEDKRTPYYKHNIMSEVDDEKEYLTVINKKKNANITKNNFGEIVLMQIPTVNITTASAIMSEYKNLNNLIDKIKENNKCLDGISYTTSKNQKRKISKTCIKNIIEFLSN
jgi:ERCC4-type nuclease